LSFAPSLDPNGILITMRIRVLFFGVLRDSISSEPQTLELDPGSTAGSVIEHYKRAREQSRERSGEQSGEQAEEHSRTLGGLWKAIAVSVNQQYAPLTAPLSDGDEVALLPPVSGGADPAPVPESFLQPRSARAWLIREPIPTGQVLAGIKAGPDGAVVLFDGIVRNNTRGRQTLYLEYHGYEPMALDQMRSLAAQVIERFQVRDAAIVHRLGRLEIGQSSVLIAVASAHRGAAFDACRWIIDTLKKTVPIYKKEYFLDGAVWADGEPFPPEILPDGGAE
jgi:molybdopterin synthase catalytic subunit